MTHVPSTFTIIPERSAIVVQARSNVGPIEFGTNSVRGAIVAITHDGLVSADAVTARLEVDLKTLSSGNSLYDSELSRRVDARAYPIAVIELAHARSMGTGARFEVDGDLTFHGMTRPLRGVVETTMPTALELTVSGEQVVDVRAFSLSSPATLMFKIFPDVRVRLHLEAASTAP